MSVEYVDGSVPGAATSRNGVRIEAFLLPVSASIGPDLHVHVKILPVQVVEQTDRGVLSVGIETLDRGKENSEGRDEGLEKKHAMR